MKLRKPRLPDPKANAKANAAGGARTTLGGKLDEVVVTAKKDKKKAKVDVCKKKGKVNELHCQYFLNHNINKFCSQSLFWGRSNVPFQL